MTLEKPSDSFDADVLAKDFLQNAVQVKTEPFDSAGYGQDIRLDGEGVLGTVLVADDVVVRLALFRSEHKEKSNKIEPMASWSHRRRSHY